MPGRPLLVTEDPLLLDDLLRLCAAGGVEPEVAPDLNAARRSWWSAPLVLVGPDAAPGLHPPPARRAGVLLVGRDMDDGLVWELAVRVGAEQVLIVPDAEAALVERIAEAVEGRVREATVLCCVGGRGGAGASTLAAALAVTATRRGLRTLLVDADPLGGGIDMVLGGEEAAGLRWPDLAGARGRMSGPQLRDALPRIHDLAVLSCDRGEGNRRDIPLVSVGTSANGPVMPVDGGVITADGDVMPAGRRAVPADGCAMPSATIPSATIPPAAMRAVLSAGRRSCDVVVVDLPRWIDAAAAEALTSGGPTLLLVPAEVRAAAAAARVAATVSAVTADLRLVVRGPAPSGLSPTLIASTLGLPLAGYLPPEPKLAEALERGEPPGQRGRGPLARFCGELLDELPAGGPEPT